MSKRLVMLFAAVVAIALIAAGCGGSSDESSTSSLTKAEFVKKGNAICVKTAEESEPKFESFAKEHGLTDGKEPSKAQIEEVATTILLPMVKDQVEQIKALGVPSGQEEQTEAVFEAVEGAIEKGEEDPSSLLKSGNASPFAKANKLADEYGLTDCGE